MKLSHIIGVARKAYAIASRGHYGEGFCRKMFTIGFLHDIGYEFSINQSEHPFIGYEMLADIRVDEDACRAIRDHGNPHASNHSEEWLILNAADMQVDGFGHDVTYEERLADISMRYGESSTQYQNALEIVRICKQNGL